MTTLAESLHRLREDRGLHLLMGIAQIFLIGVFGYAGVVKTFLPISQLSQSIPWVADVPAGLVRFIGICEIAGALGLIFPPVIRALPGILTPLASLGLMMIMVFAMVFHSFRGEFMTIPVNIILGSIALFVTWGRYKKYPFHPNQH